VRFPSSFHLAHSIRFVRRFLCIFLLLFLPLHGFALQGGWLAAGQTFSPAHENVHQQGRSHHHHPGADAQDAIHYDESDASAKHALEYCWTSHLAPALPSVAMPLPALSMRLGAFSDPPGILPDPIPERLARPPRSLG
jgi:hypothetical protein